MFQFKGKPPTALITGASRRFGLHMVQALLTKGWQVVALSRNPWQEAHPNFHCLPCDLLDEKSLVTVVQSIQARYKSLDLILHNASIYEPDAAHSDNPAAWSSFYEKLFQIHMRAPAYLNEQLAPLLKNSLLQTANIIHITDIYASNPNAHYALYCSTKAAAENLMISYAKKLAPEVRVNAIQPGPIKFLPEHTEAAKQKIMAETLLPFEGGFEALEQAVYSILDNPYMTAAVIRVDGGRSVANPSTLA